MKPQRVTIEILQKIEWLSFEKLCEEWLRGENFTPLRTPLEKDGGIDIHIYDKELKGRLGIVQCKALKTINVGIAPIREFHGVMTSEKENTGIIMATGNFTDDAKKYAKKNNIDLIPGETIIKEINNLPKKRLEELISEVLSGDYTTPTCPKCGIKMVLRKGYNFWGCKNYFTTKCNQRIYTKES